jgi:transcriptional regulator
LQYTASTPIDGADADPGGSADMAHDELKKGSTELLILALIEKRARHGYEIGKLIEARSGGRLTFRIGSLYPVLCRLEDRGLITGRWLEKAGERRRRFYRLTPEGRTVLARQRTAWKEFSAAVNQILGGHHA